MILLQRKRILLVIFFVFISIFTYMLGTNRVYNAVQVVSLPVSNKVVVLDAGHGTPDEGAQSNNRNHGGRDQSKNCFKVTELTGTKWMYCNFN